MKKAVRRRTPLLFVLLAFACGDAADGPEFADELGVDLAAMEERTGGLYVRDLEEGTGAVVQPGDLVTVHYTGWLTDGTKFDSSVDAGQPFEVVIGAGNVIPGWDDGVPGMRVGGRRQLVIPPHFAYGSSGAGGVIPPDATLVFEVEVLDTRPVGAMTPADSVLPDTSAMQDTVQ